MGTAASGKEVVVVGSGGMMAVPKRANAAGVNGSTATEMVDETRNIGGEAIREIWNRHEQSLRTKSGTTKQ